MKTRIAIIFGGKSAEHEVSARSASNIYHAVDRKKFDVILIGVDKAGVWHYNSIHSHTDFNVEEYFNSAIPVRIDNIENKPVLVDKNTHQVILSFDVVFPIIHGTFGEDGTLQGLLKSLNVPFVGPDVIGSAVCMDKDVTKRLLRDSGIPVADFITVYRNERHDISFGKVTEKLGLPVFVKPCNAGSSVGVSKVTDETSFTSAIDMAFKFDDKVLIEEAVTGKEVECGILGNDDLQVSVVGEIVPTKDFYSYEAKYIDAEGAKLRVPAEIDARIADEIRQTALKAFRVTCCKGMARVDFFLRNDQTYVLNELNTLPGFTEISMYPKVFESTGISYADLITQLVELALERHRQNNELQTTLKV
ncbi:MAG: D-alanine--D-alanine ligase [Bacteroidales bacterium]|jgi:D-alanine-D-alanine ligase|nr:D-alanine--D-alanine ligase [Bacteroidales bacterium]